MRPGLASPLMFVPEIQGAQSLSVLEVNTPRNPWRGRDILIPEPAKSWKGKLTLYRFLFLTHCGCLLIIVNKTLHGFTSRWCIFGQESELHLEILIMCRTAYTYKYKPVVQISDFKQEFMQFKRMKGHMAVFTATGFERALIYSCSVKTSCVQNVQK